MRIWCIVALSFCVLSPLIVGCAPPAVPASHLLQALALVPINASRVSFTDWSLLKKYTNRTDVNSKSDLSKRREFFQAVAKDQAFVSGYGFSRSETQGDAWSWDSTDLVWEISTSDVGAPAFALKFRDDFDFAPLRALFEQRGFSKSDYRGVTIYSHRLDVTADWLRTTEPSILNTAILASEKILILSSTPENVPAFLDVQQRKKEAFGSAKSVQSIATQLGDVPSAFISAGAQACDDFDTGINVAKLHPYAALGVAYRSDGNKLVGLIVMDYALAGDAQADLELRHQLATQGESIIAKSPYSQSVFTLDKASVIGSDLVLQVSPLGNAPRRIFDMVFRHDMLFAACP